MGVGSRRGLTSGGRLGKLASGDGGDGLGGAGGHCGAGGRGDGASDEELHDCDRGGESMKERGVGAPEMDARWMEKLGRSGRVSWDFGG